VNVIGAAAAGWSSPAGPGGTSAGGVAAGARRAVVLCGPGNNGGDGFVVARLLNERGWEVEVFLYGATGKRPPDAKANYERWLACGGTVAAYDVAALVLDPPCLFVDALFGIGQARALSEDLESTAAHITLLNGMMADIRTVAVDVPSGVNSDTGTPFGGFQFFSDLTVTFHAKKPCHVPPQDAPQCGKVTVVDIGL
jgi:hydroxyethylthiazole kinase-like uncharacterized protein yjeF